MTSHFADNAEAMYTGKAKTMLADKPGYLKMVFRDDVTAFNGLKHATPEGKGTLNCRINTLIMSYLESHGVATHFVRQLDRQTALVKKAKVLPLESIFRNRVAGSFAKKYALQSGAALAHPVIEFCIKSDELNDPLIVDQAATALGLARDDELVLIRKLTAKINTLLGKLFAKCGYQLIDGKLEFGRLEEDGELVLVDEFTPDSCRLWSAEGEHFDKDLFREDLGDLVDGYSKVYQSLSQVREQLS